MNPPATSASGTPRRFRVGLAGREILQSRSPWLHEQEALAQGAELDYELFDFADRGWTDDRLAELLRMAEQAGFAGLNVTYPFKQVVQPWLDDLSPDARRVGAVNTVAFVAGARVGYNTDVVGFEESFRAGLPGVALHNVVQLGAGGAGAATADALFALGTEHIEIFDPRAERQAALVERLSAQVGEHRIAEGRDLAVAIRAADGLVNASPVGMTKSPGLPLDVALLDQRHWVADVVYVPLATQLLIAARRLGCRTLHGGGMAVCQAAAAFEIFTGLTADRARMQASFERFAPKETISSYPR